MTLVALTGFRRNFSQFTKLAYPSETLSSTIAYFKTNWRYSNKQLFVSTTYIDICIYIFIYFIYFYFILHPTSWLIHMWDNRHKGEFGGIKTFVVNYQSNLGNKKGEFLVLQTSIDWLIGHFWKSPSERWPASVPQLALLLLGEFAIHCNKSTLKKLKNQRKLNLNH